VARKSKSESVPQKVVDALWRSGRIAELYLHKSQLEVYDQFRASNQRQFVLNSSRQWGKSFLACLVAVEQAVSAPNQQIRYAAPTAKMVQNIITPAMRSILKRAPKELQPEYRTLSGAWIFPNGSEIKVSGCSDGNHEKLRGTAAHLVIVDEAGFIAEFEYVLKDVLWPQLLTTGGRIFVASTPARTNDHYYKKVAMEAQEIGSYAHRTIFDNPRITKADMDEAERMAGGRETTTWKREYLAQFVVDEEYAIVPEFAKVKDIVMQDWERPKYFDAYVAMDVGMVDFTAVLFGYYDFQNALYVIEDELILNKATDLNTEKLATGIKSIEKRLWGEQKPYSRVSDIELLLISDLITIHGLNFIPTRKNEVKEVSLNALRLNIGQGRYRISPKCKVLIAHLENGIWNKTKTSFERSSDHGHYDAVDALLYFNRSVNTNKNPFPLLDPSFNQYTHWINPDKHVHEDDAMVRTMFGGRWKRSRGSNLA